MGEIALGPLEQIIEASFGIPLRPVDRNALTADGTTYHPSKNTD